jgi:hypothetical protein
MLNIRKRYQNLYDIINVIFSDLIITRKNVQLGTCISVTNKMEVSLINNKKLFDSRAIEVSLFFHRA